MRIATVVGTRPEIIRLSRVIAALDNAVEHTLIHTGQNHDYELNEIFFDEMKIRKPDVVMGSTMSRTLRANTAIETIGYMMIGLEEQFRSIKPDAILILGDTNSCLATAYVAKRMKIPLFHMEAGNRSYDERIPEEVNRKMIDHIADINLPYSGLAREALIREGIAPDRIIKTGSPLHEVLSYYSPDIRDSKILEKMSLVDLDYFIVSVHREENITPDKFSALVSMLNRLAVVFHNRIIISAHPRIKTRLTTWSSLENEIEIYKPFGFFDYVKLQQNARCVLSDSGTITEEASMLQFPALNLREAHERPEGMEEAAVIMTGFNTQRIIESIPLVNERTYCPDDYLKEDVAAKVVRIILSYTDYVNRVVWRKE